MIFTIELSLFLQHVTVLPHRFRLFGCTSHCILLSGTSNLFSRNHTGQVCSCLTCSHIWWVDRPASDCSDTSWLQPCRPLRSCHCLLSCPQSFRDSGSCVPRHWDPCEEWWFGRAGRQVGWGEGARHSCDPDNTQRKTVASSNNGCSGKKGNGKWRRMKMRAKKKTGVWNSSAVNNGSSLWSQKTKSWIDIHGIH